MSALDSIKLKAVQRNLIPDVWLRYGLERDLKRWRSNRQGPFPHLLKQRIVLAYARKSGARTFVETGTFYGFMLEACLDHFDLLVSVEVEPHFYLRAKNRFRRKSKVRILLGDSSDLLPQVLASIPGSILFWLDAHYSGGVTGKGRLETPICYELETILNHSQFHTILIDDAHCFNGIGDYPDVVWIENIAARNDYSTSIADNIIRLEPRSSA